jgi:hypothetical protein
VGITPSSEKMSSHCPAYFVMTKAYLRPVAIAQLCP